MPTIKEALATATKSLQDLNAFQLASRADCASPDSATSAGARMLASVSDAVAELLDYMDTDDLKRLAADPADVSWADDERVHQVADDAPSVYTANLWAQFVDLSAWQEDIEEYGTTEDMTTAAGIALYMIAERLAQRLLTDAAEILAEQYDEEGAFIDAARVIGADHGKAAASWVEIPTPADADAILVGINDIDPEVMDRLPAADLCGDWADRYTVARLVADVGAPEGDDSLSQSLADAYEESFKMACEYAIAARCRAILDN